MIQQIRAEKAAEILKTKGAAYLDVRTEPEFQQGHAVGAYNIPAFFFDASRRPVPNPDFEAIVRKALPPGTTLVVGCQSGVRSQRASEALERLGYAALHNLEGGFGGARSPQGDVVAGWKDSGLPVETGDGGDRSYAALKKNA